VPGKHLAQRGAHALQFRLVKSVLGVGGCVAAGQQQRVALAQRDVQLLGQPEDHLRRRAGAPGLDEAQVPRRDVGLDRQVKLADPAPPPPLAQQFADGTGARRPGQRHGRHLPDDSRPLASARLPPRSWSGITSRVIDSVRGADQDESRSAPSGRRNP